VFKWRAVLSEFIGTLICVFIGSMSLVTSVPSNPKLRPDNEMLRYAIGNMLAYLGAIHVLGPISGAHFNPAITCGVMATRNIGVISGLLYMIAQVLGGVAGTGLTLFIGGWNAAMLGQFQLGTDYVNRVWQGFVLEILLSFFMALVMFGCLVKPQHFERDSSSGSVGSTKTLFGFPVAIAMGACILAGGEVTGAAMNPARVIGPYLLNWSWPSYCWIYFTAPIIGSVIGACLYEFVLTKPRRSYLKV